MQPLICITCPTGCRLEAELIDGGVRVTGNACKRGEAFALAELTHPMRSLCSTVRANVGPGAMLPVRTDIEIPKGKVNEVMALIAGIVVERPVACGDVIRSLAPVCDGNLIATCDWGVSPK